MATRWGFLLVNDAIMGLRLSPTGKRLMLSSFALGLVALGLGEAVAHRQLQHRYRQTLDDKRILGQFLAALRTDHDRLSNDLLAEQQRADQLSKALSAKDQELEQTIGRLLEEERTIRDMHGKLLTMQGQIDRLQGELALSLQGQADHVVQLDRVVVMSPTSSEVGLQGRVLSVHAQWQFVVVNLGWDMVSIGDVVSFYRDGRFLAKGRVERVQEDAAAATLLPEWAGIDIRVDDVVRIL